MAYIDTENIPLHMPVPGTREPAQIALLNENCVTLSLHDHTDGKALAIGRMRSGLEANRPAAGSAGNVYFATDTGRFYADTGTAWVGFLTEGGQGTVTGWTLIDPVIRDTLQFGPEGSADIDATLARVAPNALRTNNRVGVGVTPPADQHADWSSLHIGTTMVFRADNVPTGVTSVWASNSYYGADGKGHAIVAGVSVQQVMAPQGWVVYTAPSVAAGAEQEMTPRFTMDIAGAVLLNPAVGSNALQVAWPDASFYIARGSSTSTNTRLYSSHTLEIDPANNYATPSRDNVVALGAPNLRWGAVHGGGLYATAPTNNNLLSLNTMMDVICDASGHLRFRRLPSGTTFMRVIYSVPGLFMDEEIKPAGHLTTPCGIPSSAWSNVCTGQVQGATTLAIVAPNGALNLSSATTSLVMGCVGYAHPAGDANQYLGHPSYRWATIYVASAPVVGSSLDLKERIAPLDAAACAEAVLGTDWVSYAYKSPTFTPPDALPDDAYDEHDDNDTKAEKKSRRDRREAEVKERHARVLEETAAGREQKGYVLDSPDHRVHELFGLPDRKNRSDGADIAVVACALQYALQEIATLKEQMSGQAPAA